MATLTTLVGSTGEKLEVKLAVKRAPKSAALKARKRERVKERLKMQKNFDVRFIAWYAASISIVNLTKLRHLFKAFRDNCDLVLPNYYHCLTYLKMKASDWQNGDQSPKGFKFAELYNQKENTKSIIKQYDRCVANVAASDPLEFGGFIPLTEYGNKKVNRIEICEYLLTTIEANKDKIDLFSFRHLLFCIYQFILLAAKCRSPTSSSISLLLHKSLVSWMESVRPTKPTKEMIKTHERRMALPTVMTMTKPYIFDQLFRVVDLPTLITIFLSVMRSPSPKMPSALVSIVDEYSRLDPLDPADEKLIAINLLKE